MPEGLITGLLLDVAGSILAMATQKGAAKLLEETRVSKAIDVTTEAFPKYEGLRKALGDWCSSNEFVRFVGSLKAGEREITDDDAVSSFVDAGGFYAGSETREAARQVLETFAQALENELYAAEGGLSVLAGRQEVLHEKTVRTVKEEGERVVAQLAITIQEQFSRFVSDETGKRGSAHETVFQARINEAKSLILKGKVISARSSLEQLRHETKSEAVSDELRFRISTNLGLARSPWARSRQPSRNFKPP